MQQKGRKKGYNGFECIFYIILLITRLARCTIVLPDDSSNSVSALSLLPAHGLRLSWDAELGDATLSCSNKDILWVEVDPLALPVGVKSFTLALVLSGLDSSQAVLDTEAVLLTLADLTLALNPARGED